MPQFIELTDAKLNSSALYEVSTIEKIEIYKNEVNVWFKNKTFIVVKEAYEDLRNKLLKQD